MSAFPQDFEIIEAPALIPKTSLAGIPAFLKSATNIELTSDAPPIGVKGDRLPGTPEYNANLGLRYDFELGGHSIFIRSDYAYVGGYYSNLQEEGVEAGDYHQVNARAGANFGPVNLDIFVNNLTNADEVTWVNTVVVADARAYRLRPRTIGFNVSYEF